MSKIRAGDVAIGYWLDLKLVCMVCLCKHYPKQKLEGDNFLLLEESNLLKESKGKETLFCEICKCTL